MPQPNRQQKTSQQSQKQKKRTLNQEQQLDQQELFRLQELTFFEEVARKKGFSTIVGIDEAGRGPLAGPVVAASCFFSPDVFVAGVNDSKQLTSQRRSEVYHELISHKQVHYNVAIVDHTVIDQINIYQATIRAMIEAVDGLELSVDYLLVDGLTLPHPTIPGEGIIKGDSKSQLIAAASIIAKETRDLLMLDYHKQWPEYGFDRHKGYATKVHREAIAQHGPCPIHRRSFEPIKSMVRDPKLDVVQLSIF